MPSAPLAGNAVTSANDQAGAPGARAPAPVTRGHGPQQARTLLPRRAARRAQAALPATACSDSTGSVRVENLGDRLRRIAALPRLVLRIGGSYHDPLFGRPDLVEDDYYRFRHQLRGW
jgi:hypothetical protein